MDDFLEHFRNMFSGESDQTENQESHYDENNVNFDEDLDVDISLEELKQAVFHQKNNSSYGLDNICTEAVKTLFNIILSCLLKLLNQVPVSLNMKWAPGFLTLVNILNHGDAELSPLLSKAAMQIKQNIIEVLQ